MKKREVQEVVKDISAALEIITAGGDKYELGHPDEQGLRLKIKNGERERQSNGFCVVTDDVRVGGNLELLNSSTCYFFPGHPSWPAKVEKIHVLEISSEEFSNYAIACTEKGGKGVERDYILPGGPRHPELFQRYREVLLDPLIFALQEWTYEARCYLNDGDLRWKACNNLSRVIIGLVIKGFPPDGTDYIEGKLSIALDELGYKLVRSWGDEKYSRVMESLPIHQSSPLDIESWDSKPIRFRAGCVLLSKKEFCQAVIKPLGEALEASQDHLWDKPALLILKAISFMMLEDPKINFECCCRKAEKNLWEAAFLLGYRLIKAQPKKKRLAA